jgi:hypothetical protein
MNALIVENYRFRRACEVCAELWRCLEINWQCSILVSGDLFSRRNRGHRLFDGQFTNGVNAKACCPNLGGLSPGYKQSELSGIMKICGSNGLPGSFDLSDKARVALRVCLVVA